MPFKIQTKLLVAFVSIVLFLSIFGLIIGVYNIRLILKTVLAVEHVDADPKAIEDALHLITKTTWQTLFIMLLGGLLGVAFSILLSLYISRTLSRPVKELHKGVEAIAGSNLDYRLDIHTGDEIEQLANGFNIMGERLKGFHTVLEDKVRERTKEFQESETRFRSVIETAKDAIVCIEEGGNIYIWNKAAEGMFGYPADEAIGEDVHSLIAPEGFREKAYEGLKAFSQTGIRTVVGKTIEIVGLKKDGTEFPVELSVSAMNIKNEWHAIGIIRDITERKEAEDALKRQLDELLKFQKATVQREFRMKELRERVRELEEELKKVKG